jgi:general secretion pathway protein K
MTGRLKNESGFALILTLVITALMVAVLVEMVHQVYVDTSISRGFRDGQQASILAESGVTAVQKALSLGADPALLSAYLAQPLSDDIGSLDIKISDESGKININGLLLNDDSDYDNLIKSTLLQLTKGIKIKGDTWSNVLDSVADWIDKDVVPRSGGAEAPYYLGNPKLKYRTHDGRLTTLTELSLVKGMTADMLDTFVDEKKQFKLRDCLTIYPIQQFVKSNININSAPRPVLMALDASISEQTADQIINKRPFNGTGEFPKVRELDNLSRGNWSNRLTTTSNLFRIRSVGKVKESVRIVEAVVSNGVFLSWQEY